MKKGIIYGLLILVTLSFWSCYIGVSIPYNSALGENANSRYRKPDNSSFTASNDKYTYYNLDEEDGNGSKEKQDTTVKKKDKDTTSLKIVSRKVVDTIVDRKVVREKIPIDEKQKDSLVLALIRDESLTDAQREQRMEQFIKRHIVEREVFDTTYQERIRYDTIYVPKKVKNEGSDSSYLAKEKQDSTGTNETQLLNKKISVLEKQINELMLEKKKREEAEQTKVEEQEKKKEVTLSYDELRSIGRDQADDDYVGYVPFASVFAPGISTFFLSSYIPALGWIGFLLSLTMFIYFMSARPKIDWSSVNSRYKNERAFRKGYEEGVRKKFRKNALLGFIPGMVTILILAIVALIIFTVGL